KKEQPNDRQRERLKKAHPVTSVRVSPTLTQCVLMGVRMRGRISNASLRGARHSERIRATRDLSQRDLRDRSTGREVDLSSEAGAVHNCMEKGRPSYFCDTARTYRWAASLGVGIRMPANPFRSFT